jgi:hypothetical protein
MAYVGPRMEAEPTARGQLRTAIESNIAFVANAPSLQ